MKQDFFVKVKNKRENIRDIEDACFLVSSSSMSVKQAMLSLVDQIDALQQKNKNLKSKLDRRDKTIRRVVSSLKLIKAVKGMPKMISDIEKMIDDHAKFDSKIVDLS